MHSSDRQVLDWRLDLLDTFIYISWLHSTDGYHTQLLRSSLQHSSAFGLMSLQVGGHLIPTSYSYRCLQPVLHLLAPGLDWLPTANHQLQLSSPNWLPRWTDSLCSLSKNHIENTAPNSFSIIACMLHSDGSSIIACLQSYCLEMDASLVPYCSCQASFHNTINTDF
jgi:hypothetical protein